MCVNSTSAQRRRKLHFISLEEVGSDAEKLVSSPTTKTLGNWPLSQLLTHLAMAMNGSLDGVPFRAPWYMRLFGFFLKGRMLKNGLPAGVKLPNESEASAYPTVSSSQEALDVHRTSVGRIQKEKSSATHPIFGKMTHDEWTQLHLRHAELHLSFAFRLEAMGQPK